MCGAAAGMGQGVCGEEGGERALYTGDPHWMHIPPACDPHCMHTPHPTSLQCRRRMQHMYTERTSAAIVIQHTVRGWQAKRRLCALRRANDMRLDAIEGVHLHA